MRVKNDDLLEIDGVRATKNMASTFTLQPIWLGHIVNASIQMVFTGSPVGTFTVEASNDLGQPQSSGDAQKVVGLSNWTTIAASANGISAAGDMLYTLANTGFNWVRVKYTATSGTGTLTSARSYVKGI
jgi:hypothetical protein